jgi:hypothetical protein
MTRYVWRLRMEESSSWLWTLVEVGADLEIWRQVTDDVHSCLGVSQLRNTFLMGSYFTFCQFYCKA